MSSPESVDELRRRVAHLESFVARFGFKPEASEPAALRAVPLMPPAADAAIPLAEVVAEPIAMPPPLPKPASTPAALGPAPVASPAKDIRAFQATIAAARATPDYQPPSIATSV